MMSGEYASDVCVYSKYVRSDRTKEGKIIEKKLACNF